MVVFEQPTVDFNYEELDQIIDVIEPFMLSLADEHRLIGAHTERWRWDVPGIVLVWVDRDRDNINKNIHAWIKGDSPQYELVANANAWLDDEGARDRLWNHLFAGTVSIDTRRDPGVWSHGAQMLLVLAYQEVAGWDRGYLNRTHTLTPHR